MRAMGAGFMSKLLTKYMVDAEELIDELSNELSALVNNPMYSPETKARYEFAIFAIENAKRHRVVSAKDYIALHDKYLEEVNKH